jgi:hypothetical protein
MITELSGLPDGMVGFEASGKLAAEDYRDVLLPAVEEAAAAGDVRIVIVMRDFEGLTGGALWHDMKMGMEHLGAWKKIALVTDIGWMRHATDLFGWMTPGERRRSRSTSAPKRSLGRRPNESWASSPRGTFPSRSTTSRLAGALTAPA